MFLDGLKGFKVLHEADEENKPQDEPMEKDASANQDNDENGMGEEAGGEDPTANTDMNDVGGDDSGEGDSSGEEGGGDDYSTTDEGESENSEESLKKQRLFKDYKRLIDIMNDVMDLISLIPYDQLSEDAKKIFNFIEQKMNENYDKIIIIATKQFNNLTYKQLMTLYIYLKMNTKDYTDIVKYFVGKQREQ
jgi:cobalamin biosynthesis protein CobT